MNPAYLLSQKKMRKILQSYRDSSPVKTISKNEAAAIDLRIGHIQDKPVKRLVIHFHSNGCGWKNTSGGCTMCGFWNETTQMKDRINADNFINQYESVLKKIDLRSYPILCLYNAGSLLNAKEVPHEALEYIFKSISTVPEIQRVAIESRVEYADAEKIAALKSLLKGRELVIGTGFESSNDIIRELCVHKGIQKKKFENYIEHMRSQDISTRIYILIKPPFLTEAEAIEDAVATTKYLYSLGIKDIHYETMTIEENTLVSTLYHKGLYQLPWLWSIIEIIKQVSPFINPYISPFRYITDSQMVPSNCKWCSQSVTDAILNKYCADYDLSHLMDLDCSCHSNWQTEMDKKNDLPVEERVGRTLEALSEERRVSS
jgi:hypothetical protein